MASFTIGYHSRNSGWATTTIREGERLTFAQLINREINTPESMHIAAGRHIHIPTLGFVRVKLRMRNGCLKMHVGSPRIVVEGVWRTGQEFRFTTGVENGYNLDLTDIVYVMLTPHSMRSGAMLMMFDFDMESYQRTAQHRHAFTAEI